MINRARLAIEMVLLVLFLGFLGSACGAAETSSDVGPDTEGLGLEPSEKPEVQGATKAFQDFLDRLSAATPPKKAKPKKAEAEQPKPKSFLEKVEFYVQENRSLWYVILGKLGLAGLLGLVLSVVYRASYTKKMKKYSPSMMQTQLLLCVGGSLVWIIVGNYLVRAFGLGGMMGFIRYRTRIRDPKDTVLVLVSMMVGMACGLGQVTVALVSTGFISLVLIGMHQFRLGKKKKKKKEPESEEAPPEVTDQD